jgi:hypothetical protein
VALVLLWARKGRQVLLGVRDGRQVLLWQLFADSLSPVDVEVSDELKEANEAEVDGAEESQQVNGVKQQKSLVDYKAPLPLRSPASIANLRGIPFLKYCQIPHKFKFLLRPIVHFL